MATRTFTHTVIAGGLVVLEFDVNDANWRMSQVRCINKSDKAAVGYIYEGTTLRYTANAPANQTTSWNTTGVQLGWDSVDGGLIMGNYTIQFNWPA